MHPNCIQDSWAKVFKGKSHYQHKVQVVIFKEKIGYRFLRNQFPTDDLIRHWYNPDNLSGNISATVNQSLQLQYWSSHVWNIGLRSSMLLMYLSVFCPASASTKCCEVQMLVSCNGKTHTYTPLWVYVFSWLARGELLYLDILSLGWKEAGHFIGIGFNKLRQSSLTSIFNWSKIYSVITTVLLPTLLTQTLIWRE